MATEDMSRINSQAQPSMDNMSCCSNMNNNTVYNHMTKTLKNFANLQSKSEI